MQITPQLIKSLAIVAAFGAAAVATAETDIARWSFTSVVAAPDNTPTATTDLTSAFLTQLGMTNSYNTGNTASCDVDVTGGDPNTLSNGDTWRVRGAQSPAGDNGWALAAPQWTQGAEMDVSTVGYNAITVGFDWYTTTQGIADLQVQYNLNVNNSAGWTSYAGAFNGNQLTATGSDGGTLLVATTQGYNTMGDNVTFNMIDLSSISGAANDADFGIRLVSAYSPTLGNYAAATGGGVYNNNSGNWRFDQLFVDGSPLSTPEPVSCGALALGAVAMLRRRKRA